MYGLSPQLIGGYCRDFGHIGSNVALLLCWTQNVLFFVFLFCMVDLDEFPLSRRSSTAVILVYVSQSLDLIVHCSSIAVSLAIHMCALVFNGKIVL